MDILTGLNAVSTALKITKDLRDLDVSLNEAELKAKFAELYSSLADAKMALADAKIELHFKELKISELRSEIEGLKSGDICPSCRSGRLNVTATKPHPTFGELGILERIMTCEDPSCGHSEPVLHDPSNILDK